MDSKQSETDGGETGRVKASLQIIFETTSDIKEDTVTETMMDLTCESCPLQGNFACGF